MWMWKGPISFKVSCCIAIATFILCSLMKRFAQEYFFSCMKRIDIMCHDHILYNFFSKELERLGSCTCNRKGQFCVMGLLIRIKRSSVKANADHRSECYLSELRMWNVDSTLVWPSKEFADSSLCNEQVVLQDFYLNGKSMVTAR